MMAQYPMAVGSVDAGWNYSYINGFNGASSLRGDYGDIRFAKGASESALALPAYGGTQVRIKTAADAVTMLSSPAWGTSVPVWIAFAVAAEGYRTFRVSLTSSLNQDLNVSAWMVPDIDTNAFVGVNLTSSGGPLFADPVITAEILNNVNNAPQPLAFGPAGKDNFGFSGWPLGWCLIKLTRTTAPTAGNIRVGIARQK